MAIESFGLQKIYFKFFIDAFAKDFLRELSNRRPNSLHSFHNSFVLVIAWFWMQLTINLTNGLIIFRVLWRGKFSSLSYQESNLSLIVRETMRLLVNHQLIPIAIHPKSIYLEQICYERSQGIAATS